MDPQRLRHANEQLLHQQIEIAREVLAISRKTREILRQRLLEQLAGDELAKMMADCPTTIRYLRDGQDHLRLAALILLEYHWGSPQELLMACCDIIVNDCSIDVRVAAIYCLSRTYAGSSNQEFGRMMAAIVLDASQPMSVRFSAYHSLFVLVGATFEQLPEPKDVSGKFHLPNKVNWDFVQTFL